MHALISYGYQWRPYNYSEFYCDSDDDVKNLPTTKNEECSVGSKAFVPSSGHTYVLGSDDKWIIDACALSGGATELGADAVTTVNVADKNITKAKLSDTVQASLELADSALQDSDIEAIPTADIQALFA